MLFSAAAKVSILKYSLRIECPFGNILLKCSMIQGMAFHNFSGSCLLFFCLFVLRFLVLGREFFKGLLLSFVVIE